MTADGRAITLHREADGYMVRVGNEPLMGSRTHGSEAQMAELALRHIESSSPRVLIGGLGMGFTLRAALDVLPSTAEVVVVELLPCIVEWNYGVLADLAKRPLQDVRVRLIAADFVDHLAGTEDAGRYDAILVDVDNGPEAFTTAGNARIYDRTGLQALQNALVPGGTVAIWSAFSSGGFERSLEKAGFEVEVATVRGHAGKGARHTIFLGTKGQATPRRP
ncbi:MAG TPA: hypothetical protein VEL28_01870 [Candidatus Binatia bacterium]|nr:hypothetical protein [Candidatus Binatia bacterium]